MFDDYLVIEDHVLRTQNLEEYHHPNFVLDFGSADLTDMAVEYIQEILALIVSGRKTFESGNKISMFCCISLLVLEGDCFHFYEPVEEKSFVLSSPYSKPSVYVDETGQSWNKGVCNGLEAVMKMFEVAKDCGMEKEDIEYLDLSLVCSVSDRVGNPGQDIILERKYPHLYHSGWIISAEEDQGNPGAFRRLGLDVFNRKKLDILPYLCLPVGSRICLKKDGQVTIDIDDSESEIAWDEPEEVWVHHNTVDTGNWIVSSYLSDASDKAPNWEWLVCEQIDHNTAQICSIPFLSHSLSYGDVVEVDDNGVISKVVHKSKNTTIRIQSPVFDMKYEHPVLKFLFSDKSITHEWMNDNFVAINFPTPKQATDFVCFVDNFPEVNIVSHNLVNVKHSHMEMVQHYLLKALPPSIMLSLLVGLLANVSLVGRLLTAYVSCMFIFALLSSYLFVSRHLLNLDYNRYFSYQFKFFSLTWLTSLIITMLITVPFNNPLLIVFGLIASFIFSLIVTPRNLKESILIPQGIAPPSPYRHAIYFFNQSEYIEISQVKEESDEVMITSCIGDDLVVDSCECFSQAYSQLSSKYGLLAKDWKLN